MRSEMMTIDERSPLPLAANRLLRNSRLEMRFWIALLVLANLGLLLANIPASNLIFDSTAVATNQWWRILSWPFVHVSRYHLLIDGTAFLLLYAGLEENNPLRRILLVFSAAVGSLLLPLAVAPQIHQIGLCGLSGIAHGLTAVSALELMRHPKQKRLGGTLLAGLFLKTGWELWTGAAFLQNLHLGDIGHPIVATHAGGIIGGLLGYMALQLLTKLRSSFE